MNFNRDATPQEASTFPPVSARAEKNQNQYFICCSCLFNPAVCIGFLRNNEKTGFKKKLNCKGYELFFFPPTNMCEVFGCSHQFLALSLKTLICLNTCELGFNYHDPPEVFLLFLLHYAKNMKQDQLFMSPPTKASNMLTLNNKFGMENLVLAKVF